MVAPLSVLQVEITVVVFLWYKPQLKLTTEVGRELTPTFQCFLWILLESPQNPTPQVRKWKHRWRGCQLPSATPWKRNPGLVGLHSLGRPGVATASQGACSGGLKVWVKSS